MKPISRIATTSNVLVVNNALPAKNVAELVKLAREKPGALNYASGGVGTPAHLAGEMLNLLADMKVVHIPDKGAAPALTDVIAETVRVMSQPEMKEKVLATGATPAGDSQAGFEAYMAKERQRLGEVITRRGIVLAD